MEFWIAWSCEKTILALDTSQKTRNRRFRNSIDLSLNWDFVLASFWNRFVFIFRYFFGIDFGICFCIVFGLTLRGLHFYRLSIRGRKVWAYAAAALSETDAFAANVQCCSKNGARRINCVPDGKAGRRHNTGSGGPKFNRAHCLWHNASQLRGRLVPVLLPCRW